MGRLKNDGLGRFGGRQKGTPNKINSDLKEWITSIINNGQSQFIDDLRQLEPKERVKVYTGLLNYVLPKQQAIQAEIEKGLSDPGMIFIVQNEEQKELIKQMKDR